MQNESKINLYSFYNLLSKYSSVIKSTSKNNLKSISTDLSIWPNLVYCLDSDFFNEEKNINELSNNIIKKELPALVLVSDEYFQYDMFKKKGFYLVEKWDFMYLEMEKLIKESEKINEYKVEKVNTNEDFSEWVKLLSESLFNNKNLFENIFIFLKLKNCDFFMVKNSDKIIGTSLVYYDENQIAGIYMVSVDSNFRKQGIGSMIMRTTLNSIYKKGVTKVTLQSTKIGIPLYNSLGFKSGGQINLLFKIK